MENSRATEAAYREVPLTGQRGVDAMGTAVDSRVNDMALARLEESYQPLNSDLLPEMVIVTLGEEYEPLPNVSSPNQPPRPANTYGAIPDAAGEVTLYGAVPIDGLEDRGYAGIPDGEEESDTYSALSGSLTDSGYGVHPRDIPNADVSDGSYEHLDASNMEISRSLDRFPAEALNDTSYVTEGNFKELMLPNGAEGAVTTSHGLPVSNAAGLKLVFLVAKPGKNADFEGELEEMRNIPHHPNLARYEGEAFFIGERLSIAAVKGVGFDKANLSGAVLIRAFSGAMKGVAALHAAGLIHRDIKASNLLVSTGPDGHLHGKVTDFGTVTRRGDSISMSADRRYQAPELWESIAVGGAREANESLDGWSVGLTLISLFGGTDDSAGNSKVDDRIPSFLATLHHGLDRDSRTMGIAAAYRVRADKINTFAANPDISYVNEPPAVITGLVEDLLVPATERIGVSEVLERLEADI